MGVNKRNKKIIWPYIMLYSDKIWNNVILEKTHTFFHVSQGKKTVCARDEENKYEKVKTNKNHRMTL